MLALIFPGQGSQQIGMGKEVVENFPVAQKVFEEADDALGFSISRLCFEGPEDQLQLTAHAQPAILTVSVAIYRALQSERGFTPDFVAGHSLGEYTALVCAGSMSFADAVRTVHKRGTFMQKAVPEGQGGMAAVMGVKVADVEALCRDAAEGQILCPANFNAPSQVVIAGHAEAVDRAVVMGKKRKAVVRKLKVSAPFHCPLMEPAAAELRPVLEALSIQDPRVPVITNVEAQPNSEGPRVQELLVRQVTAPVKWEASVRKMVELGVKEMMEIGRGKTLTGLVKRIDKGVALVNVEQPEEVEEARWITTDDGTRKSRDGSDTI